MTDDDLVKRWEANTVPYGEEEADWITDHLIAALKGETP